MIGRVRSQTCPHFFKARILESRREFDRRGKNSFDASCGHAFVKAGVLDGCPGENPPVIARHKVYFFRPEHSFDFQFVGAQRGHLSLGRPHRRVRGNSFDRSREAAGRNNRPLGFHFFVLQNQSPAALAFAPDGFHAAAGKQFSAAALSRYQHRSRQCTVVYRRFLRPEHGGFDFFAQRRFEFARIFGSQRLRLQPQPMMNSDNCAELGLGIVRKQCLQRSLGPEARALPGNFLNQCDKFRILRRALLPQLHGGDLPGIFRCKRNDSRAGPRSFLAWLLSVKHRDAQTCASQFHRYGPANDSAACNRDVRLFHGAILSHLAPRFMVATGFPTTYEKI